MRKRFGWILFIAYCLLLLWLTILSRQPRPTERIFKWELFWAYRAWATGVPGGKTESIQSINNILVFIPFGLLFPGKDWKWLLLTVIAFSSVIEAIQYIFNLGWCEIDDVICNVLGAVIGYGILKLVKGKVNAVRKKDGFL